MNKSDIYNYFDFSLDEEKRSKLDLYYNLLVDINEKMNLTTITDELDVYIKHFYDSMLVSKVMDLSNKTLLDIGTGAGFPGLVLKILYPNLKVTLLEPTNKRCQFLLQVIDELKLNDIVVINDRTENYIKENREIFDVVTARAVSPLNILIELALPFVKINGFFLAMKGINYQEELDKSTKGISLLGGKVIASNNYKLPLDKGNRAIISIKKIKETSIKYPRMYAKIKNQPL